MARLQTAGGSRGLKRKHMEAGSGRGWLGSQWLAGETRLYSVRGPPPSCPKEALLDNSPGGGVAGGLLCPILIDIEFWESGKGGEGKRKLPSGPRHLLQ